MELKIKLILGTVILTGIGIYLLVHNIYPQEQIINKLNQPEIITGFFKS